MRFVNLKPAHVLQAGFVGEVWSSSSEGPQKNVTVGPMAVVARIAWSPQALLLHFERLHYSALCYPRCSSRDMYPRNGARREVEYFASDTIAWVRATGKKTFQTARAEPRRHAYATRNDDNQYTKIRLTKQLCYPVTCPLFGSISSPFQAKSSM